MLIMKKKICTKGSERYGSDKGSVTHGRTDIHGGENIMSPFLLYVFIFPYKITLRMNNIVSYFITRIR